jgi:hypothetical protein
LKATLNQATKGSNKMKMKHAKPLTLALAAVWISASSMAAITPTSDDFSTDTSASWLDVGTSPATIVYDSNSAHDWYDGDDLTYITNYVPGMDITGDGLLNDGGLRLDTKNLILGDEAIGLTIGGTMEEGRKITFSGNLYNDNTSYTDVNVQLWNLTDGTLLAESVATRVKNYNNISYSPVDFSLSYTVLAIDDGDTLQIRFRDAVTATARDIFVDNYSVSSTPPAEGTHLTWDFGTDSGELTNNVAQWDYTSQQTYVGSNAVANTLAFNGKSSGTDYWIVDKGAGHEKSLLVRTLNTFNGDFGVYLQKMDFTMGGQNTSNMTRVAYSFDILGTDHAGIDPTDWTVKIAYANSSVNLNVSDAWFNGGNTVTNQTFDFVDDDATWTTVTGSYDIAVGAAGSAGGIQISADNGGYTSADGIVLDNIEVHITTIVPTFEDQYNAWLADYPTLGANTNQTDNPDGDTLNNLYEFGLGGNPTNGADIGYSPEYGTEASGGTNYFVYVHPVRDGAVLDYYLELNTDLVFGSWTNNGGYEVVGTGDDAFGAGFDAVTNHISTESKTMEFIRLQIEAL